MVPEVVGQIELYADDGQRIAGIRFYHMFFAGSPDEQVTFGDRVATIGDAEQAFTGTNIVKLIMGIDTKPRAESAQDVMLGADADKGIDFMKLYVFDFC